MQANINGKIKHGHQTTNQLFDKHLHFWGQAVWPSKKKCLRKVLWMFHNRKNSDDSPDQDDSRLDWRTLRIGKIYWYWCYCKVDGCQWAPGWGEWTLQDFAWDCLGMIWQLCAFNFFRTRKKKHHENWELPEKIRRIAVNIMVGSPARWKNHLVLPALSKKMGTIPWISKMSQTCRI